MEFDFTWVLLGFPIAFTLGWLASRLDLRQLRIENRQAPKAYFKGLNFLLNEQQDQAIDAFIEAVQNDPDTSELHFALGNLFRRRGEYERAVRVHEHLMSRGDLRSRCENWREHHSRKKPGLRCCPFMNVRATGLTQPKSPPGWVLQATAASVPGRRITSASRLLHPQRQATQARPWRHCSRLSPWPRCRPGH